MPLSRRTDCGDARFIGLEVKFASDIVETLEETRNGGFDFLVAPLAHPRHRRCSPTRTTAGAEPPAPFTRSDLLLSSSEWGGQVVGHVSEWLDPDSANPRLRADSKAALVQEIGWAAHLALQATILPPPPKGAASVNYALIINRMLLSLSHMGLWVTIPYGPSAAAQVDPGKTGEDAGGGAAEGGGGWDSWNTLRQACEHHQLLGVALKLPVELLPGAERFSQRWLGEPVRAVLLPTRCFRPNKRGFPTLPPAYQTLLSQALAVGIQVILTGAAYIRAPAPERPAGASGGGVPEAMEGKVVVRATEQGGAEVGRSHPLLPYMEYLAWLFRKLPVAQGQESMEVRYRDYLQMPLQPLQDNLESLTYETFERDSIKYVKYEEAVLAALRDRQAARPPSDKPVVIMVVGAGRGPLVKASLSAAERCGCPVKVWAVEKNSNAVVTLQHRSKDEDWQGRVTIVCADMRTWAPQEKADILVSELLGSFGDNELCPECLDGAQRFLKEEGGVSIPCEYTSYLAPITAAKLYTDVKSHAELKHFETPYVVKLCRFAPLAPPQRVFRFTHPNRTLPIDNTREASLRFRQDAGPGNMMCHGFAGYFDTVLYGDIRLSTHPDTHTPDMHSWFPIFFPLRMPVFLPPDSTLEVHMTREVAAHKVWYEWWVSQPCLIPVHNPGGRSYYVGL